ncbi:MAG: alpha/beta hydrolase, partial [Succinivibrio sp.]
MFKALRHAILLSAAAAAISSGSPAAGAPGYVKRPAPEALKLTGKWDKVFKQSSKVDHSKVVFVNRFGITLAADLYKPKGAKGDLPALAVSGPFGAVKEQVSGLYAQTMAERGYLAIAFDPSFTGESGGFFNDAATTEIYTEDFSAAVDYLE